MTIFVSNCLRIFNKGKSFLILKSKYVEGFFTLIEETPDGEVDSMLVEYEYLIETFPILDRHKLSKL